MEKDFWHERWRSGQIGFHRDEVHWALTRHWSSLGLPAGAPVLVPLSGKSLDMHWLHQNGYPVCGVELDRIAVRDFFAEWNRQAQSVGVDARGLSGYRADDVVLWQGDFFDYVPSEPFPAFYDRAALIALPPNLRAAYAGHLRKCMIEGARGLLVTLEYDQKQKEGPPFSVLPEEVSRLDGFISEPLERRDVLNESPKFKNRGISSLHETVYLLQAV